ncbi:pyrroline-5-carboxylate reductase 3 isoform X5 [Anguilla rostrata]|uniref:pyrroline-5-carboxylate reductase 3 isoform X5 n=1 Tax=Anguilla rostrata TaxID=7938 RepID=UPI0030D39A12
MKKANPSHLPTKITAKDRAKQFPNVLHESEGKLFCTPCNIVMEHKRKSSLDSHFSTAKHLKMVLMPQHRHRRITVTEATISKSVASSESIKITKDSTGKIDTVTIKSEVLSDPGGKMNKVSTQCKTEQRCSADVPIGFVGAGNMAFGITQGILMSGEVSAENVRVSAPSSNNLGRFREMGVGITHSNTEVVSSSRLVFLAVKPHLVPGVLQEIASHVTREHIVVSVAAGVTVATVEALLPPDSVVLRLMPNLPCLVQEGALLFARGSKARPEHGALLRDLLAPCGLVEEGPESWIDAHTGLSGSGVAFVYLFAEALAEGGVKMGMPSALAHRIAAQTVLGAGRLLRDSGKHPAQLRADVCTPGGTTIFGLHELERGGVRAATMGAVEAATERARELGRK